MHLNALILNKMFFSPELWSSSTGTQGVGAWDTREFLIFVLRFLIGRGDEFAAVSDVSAELSGKNCSFYAFFRDFSHFYAQIRAVFTRFLASQARHKLGAQVGCSLARNVVAFLRVRPIY